MFSPFGALVSTFAQNIISQGLDDKILRFKSIEAFRELAKSDNAKVIVSDGDLPMLMDLEPEKEMRRNTSIKN